MTSAFFLFKWVAVMSGRGGAPPPSAIYTFPDNGGLPNVVCLQETHLFHFGGLPYRGTWKRDTHVQSSQVTGSVSFPEESARSVGRAGGISWNADKTCLAQPTTFRQSGLCLFTGRMFRQLRIPAKRPCFPCTESSGVFPDFSWIKEQHK